MAKAITRVSFDEFAHNLEDYFERVVRDEETIVVEKAEGERVVLSPGPAKGYTPKKRTAADREAFLSSFGSWSDVDVDAFLKYIYERRDVPSRPPVEL